MKTRSSPSPAPNPSGTHARRSGTHVQRSSASVRTTASAAPGHSDSTARPGVRQSRLDKEAHILKVAVQHFAQYGYEGISIDSIAQGLGISRHNLLYYYPSKDALYQAAIAHVLDPWLQGMGQLSRSDDPAAAVRQYIEVKMQISQQWPEGARLFAQEIMAGAPRIRTVLSERVLPMLKDDVACFERWAEQGRVARIDFTQLMFIIWSVTQAYAELEPQFAFLLDRPKLLSQDYDRAQSLIVGMVLSALGLAAPPANAALHNN